jgi:general secretion pathway protein D
MIACQQSRTGRFRLVSVMACVFAAAFPGLWRAAAAQEAQAPVVTPPAASANALQTTTSTAKPVRESDRRRATRLYLAASKLFMNERFEEALKQYEEAAKLDPANSNYMLAAGIARSHAVTALIQAATKARLKGDEAGARAALAHALELDPRSAEATQHMYELGMGTPERQSKTLYEQTAASLGEAVRLAPAELKHSFHLRGDARSIVREVFAAYGIDAMMDDSVPTAQTRFDIDDAEFETASRAANLISHTFYVALDAHRVVVAADTPAKRTEFIRQVMETIHLGGLKSDEMTEVSNLAKQVFNMQQAQVDTSARSIVVRAPRDTVEAFNATLRALLDGHSQVLLDVRLIQPPQTFTAFNVYAEEQSILNANQSLVEEIISSGLAAPGDTLAILGILLASGQVSSSLFSNGIALFGGGITQSGLSPGGASAHFALNSSDSRALDNIQLRLGDGEQGSIKEGQRYPIQTSSFSSLSASSSTIAGLTTAGTSSSLSSLLSSLSSTSTGIPQVEYQDLGLTLKATANVMRNDQVALTIDMAISALSGSTLNGNPILNSRSYSGVVTIKEGTAVVVASELDKSESRSISGTPGFSEIPGMSNVTDKDANKSYSTLLIVITPHVVRGIQAAGHTPIMRIERTGQSQ